MEHWRRAMTELTEVGNEGKMRGTIRREDDCVGGVGRGYSVWECFNCATPH